MAYGGCGSIITKSFTGYGYEYDNEQGYYFEAGTDPVGGFEYFCEALSTYESAGSVGYTAIQEAVQECNNKLDSPPSSICPSGCPPVKIGTLNSCLQSEAQIIFNKGHFLYTTPTCVYQDCGEPYCCDGPYTIYCSLYAEAKESGTGKYKCGKVNIL